MTDKEIIKALECCTEDVANCPNCPYERHCDMLENNMLMDALDLINRQKKEIERLEKTIKSYEKIRRAYQRYIHGHGWEDLWDVAIKEFAERVTSEDVVVNGLVWTGDIIKIYKEMTEDQNDV